MKRTTIRLATIGLGFVILATVGCPTVPILTAIPTTYNFGESDTMDTVTIRNNGGGLLTWSIGAPPAWLQVSADSGTLGAGESVQVTLETVRSAVATGTYTAELPITSNGGTETLILRMVKAGPTVPASLEYSPVAIAIGNDASAVLTVGNAGSGTISWSIDENLDWLSVSPLSGEATNASPSQVVFTAERAGLAPGLYSGDVLLSSSEGDVTIPVTMNVPVALPVIDVSVESIAFGETDNETEFTIANASSGTLDWTIATNVATVGNWLQVSPALGSTTTTPETITVTAVRSNLTPADYPATLTDLTGTITINSNTSDGNDPVVINVTMTVRPTELTVSPVEIDFRTYITNKLVSIGNAGVGRIDWTLTEAIPWLSISPDPATGTVNAGETPDSVILTANRGALADGEVLQDTFTVSAVDGLGNPLPDVTVSVRVKAPDNPILVVECFIIDENGVEQLSETNEVDPKPYVNFGEDLVELTVLVRNGGNSGTVNWQFDLTDQPDWLTDVFPVQGALLPDDDPTDNDPKADVVTLRVDRSDLTSGGYPFDIPVLSNAGTEVIRISMNVPKIVSIGVDPASLNFGQDTTVGSFFVANMGDPGTVLDFRATSDQFWLFHSPQTGSSIGVSTPPPFKDWQTVNVAVDRYALNGIAGTGIFEVRAIEYVEGVETFIDEDEIEPQQVVLTVEPIPLLMETADARLRIPSLVRWPMILRDYKDRAIIDDPTVIGASAFSIREAGVALNLDETSQFLTSGVNLKTNVIVLMDYSGSMLASAEAAGLDAEPDPVQTLYGGPLNGLATPLANGLVGNLMDQLPSNYRIALMEFHDRSRATFLHQDFTEDRTTLQAALSAISIEDNGASELLPASDEAIETIISEDGVLIPYDGADVRAIVLISDGGATTPSGDTATTITDTIDAAVGGHVQFFTVGWGRVVNHEPLARLAAETGGHYYPVRPEDDPASPGDIRPSLENLAEVLERVEGDLESFIVLSYATLNEESNADVRVNASFNPELTNPPAPVNELDQGIVTGNLAQLLTLSSVVGDVLMGQISMRSSGIQPSGAATLTIRAEYVPRNINKFQFTISSTAPLTPAPTLVPASSGGLIEGWTLTDLGGGTYRVDAPAAEDVLPYGAFGDLVQVAFGGLNPAGSYTVSFAADNSIYLADTEPKSFIFPDTLRLSADSWLSPAFPTPYLEPSSLAFGSNPANDPSLDVQTFDISNIGGFYPQPPAASTVQLDWVIEDFPFFLNVAPSEGSLTTGATPGSVVVTVDRTAEAGTYLDFIPISYSTGTLGVQGTVYVTVSATILDPILTLNSNTFTLNDPDTTATLSITNPGQSTLNWDINTTPSEAWLTVSPSTGGTVNGETDDVTITVDRTGLPSGTNSTQFIVTSDVGFEIVTVNVVVP